ncbi:MFS transporter [Nocardioides lijunqiniae]|uniref:MFS transporter n=1 Tax=Nocardioides lijunqiniae TaxID=2760832 RepID=UPI0030B7FCB7
MSHPSTPSRSTVRRARAGVSLMFFTNGVLLAALLPRYPEIKAQLDLDNSEFGLVLVAFPVGALVAAAYAGRVTRAVGVLRAGWVGSVLLAVAFAMAAASTSALLFAAALFAAGAIDAVVDAAQNIHGVIVEDRAGRSIINSLHALWSLGAASGGLIGAWCAARDVDLTAQMVVNGAVWAAVAVLATLVARLPSDSSAQEAAPEGEPEAGGTSLPSRRGTWALLAPLGLLAICGTLVEDVANNWSVLYLQVETDAPLAVAGLGVSVMLAAQFVGRLFGDPMTDRWGRDRVARAGGLLIALGALVAIVAPVYPLTVAGLAISGFGSATLVPAVFAAAGRVPGLPEGTGIAILGWLMRVGFLITSPVVGVVSDASSLRVAWALPLVAGIVAAGLAERARRTLTAVPDVASGVASSTR